MVLKSYDIFAKERKTRHDMLNLEIDTVTAVGIILNMTAPKVYSLFTRQLFETKSSPIPEFNLPDTEEVIKTLREQGYQHYIIYESLKFTPNDFIKANPKGKFIIAGDSYCIAVIDSDVYIGKHRPFKWFWWHKIRNKPITSIYAYNEITLLVEKNKVDIAFADKKVD